MASDYEKDRAKGWLELENKLSQMQKEQPVVRKFETGATRDVDTGKYAVYDFISPLVLRRFCQYMHKHRFQRDGTIRAGDNWQKGIPLPVYLDSLERHNLDLWLMTRGFLPITPLAEDEDIEDVCCAIMFNIQGYLFETLKARGYGVRGMVGRAAPEPEQTTDAQDPTDRMPAQEPTDRERDTDMAGRASRRSPFGSRG